MYYLSTTEVNKTIFKNLKLTIMKLQESIDKRKELTDLLRDKTGRRFDHVSFCYRTEIFSIQITNIGCSWECGTYQHIENYINDNAEKLKSLGS